MKNKQGIILLLFMLLAGYSVLAQELSLIKLSLAQAKQLALEKNANVVNATLDVESAKKKVWETTTIGLPQINAKTDYQNTFTVPELSFGSYVAWWDMPAGSPITQDMVMDNTHDSPAMPLGTKENITTNITASQLLFSGEYIVGLQASKVYRDLTKHSLTKSRNEIIESTSNAYVLVLIAEQSKELMEKTLVNIEKLAEETKAYYKEGFVEETDADQMIITASSIRISVANMERQTKLSYDLLKMQMGIELSDKIELSESLDQILNTSEIEALINKALNIYSNPDFLLVETQEALMQLDYKRTLSKNLPTLAAFYQYTHKTNKPEFDFMPTSVVGVSLSLPIFASGQRFVQAQQAKIEVEKAGNMKFIAEQGLILQTTEARNNLSSSLDTYNNLKQSMQLSKRIYDRTEIKYKEGISSSLDLTQVNNQYLEIQGKYFQSIMNLMNAKNKLIKLSGNDK